MTALYWLARDTFRQASAAGLTWMMLAVSGVCVAFCLSVSVSGETPVVGEGERVEALNPNDPKAADPRVAAQGVDVPRAELRLAFGAFRYRTSQFPAEVVAFLQLVLAGFVADGVGVTLALVWTAGFVPAFLDPAAAAVLLAKPTPRWLLLAGKFLGVLLFVAVQALVFVGGTWLALGVSTGVWGVAYLLAVPLLLLHFAAFYAVSTLVAVVTRSPAASAIGGVLFWVLCWGMNYGRVAAAALGEHGRGLSAAAEVGYWVLPKPADLAMLLYAGFGPAGRAGTPAPLQAAWAGGDIQIGLSALTTALFAAVTLAVAAYEFEHKDY